MKEFDENDWIFVANDRAYRCCIWGDSPWLFRWRDGEKCWESIRKLTGTDVLLLPHNLSNEQQEHYRRLEAETLRRLTPDK